MSEVTLQAQLRGWARGRGRDLDLDGEAHVLDVYLSLRRVRVLREREYSLNL